MAQMAENVEEVGEEMEGRPENSLTLKLTHLSRRDNKKKNLPTEYLQDYCRYQLKV